MNAKTIEEMRKELEQAGISAEWLYAPIGDDIYTFFSGNGIEVSGNDKTDSIIKAYAHYQQQKTA